MLCQYKASGLSLAKKLHGAVNKYQGSLPPLLLDWGGQSDLQIQQGQDGSIR
jgi:hypothetical protein